MEIMSWISSPETEFIVVMDQSEQVWKGDHVCEGVKPVCSYSCRSEYVVARLPVDPLRILEAMNSLLNSISYGLEGLIGAGSGD